MLSTYISNMITHIQRIQDLRGTCDQYRDEILILLKEQDENSQPISGFFTSVRNQSLLLVEILTCFHKFWSNPPVKLPNKEIEQIRMDNWYRCNHLYRDLLFIMIMSAIEHRAKAAIDFYQTHHITIKLRGRIKTQRFSWFHCSVLERLLSPEGTKPNIVPTKNLYLRSIMRNSKDILINSNQFNDWAILIDIRNCVVHNNAYPRDNRQRKIGELTIIEKNDEMIRGKMDFFLSLSEIAVDRYYQWITSLIKKCS